ncbi:hypothetical protein [Janthinobacterium sp. RA13]|uniref:hypothetical protein n=1 Tax=Janthinobacterium sp. RA13 TaxID=1502762 RepID=UPI00126A0618|nr:hypothetical protein [Janthinobacterium sp. RA13]
MAFPSSFPDSFLKGAMMTILFNDLSWNQQEQFKTTCLRHGIDPTAVRATLSTENMGKGVLCGHPAASSAFPPDNIVQVDSIKQLKALGRGEGVDDVLGATGAAEVSYPTPLAEMAMPDLAAFGGKAVKLRNSLSRPQFQAVSDAMNAYLLGDSSRVADYEDYINTLHFPLQMAVYAVTDLEITAANPLLVDNSNAPTSLIFGTVTVQPGGYIEARSTLQMNVQTMTIVS